jgi:hypothetical protein
MKGVILKCQERESEAVYAALSRGAEVMGGMKTLYTRLDEIKCQHEEKVKK